MIPEPVPFVLSPEDQITAHLDAVAAAWTGDLCHWAEHRAGL